jgi:diguanylate cyclase (GGDEF)-like protein
MDREIKNASEKKNVKPDMLDIDYFTVYNDSFGHQKGDQVLKEVAKILKECTPESLLLCQYGGKNLPLFFQGEYESTRLIGEKIRCKMD